MLRIAIGVFISLHGLVHLWYITLSQGWVAFQPEMGWTGESWLFTKSLGNHTTSILAAVLYGLATIVFLVAGIGFIANQDWSRTLMFVGSAISAITILIFWDGILRMPVEKGLIGLLINIGIIAALLIFK